MNRREMLKGLIGAAAVAALPEILDTDFLELDHPGDYSVEFWTALTLQDDVLPIEREWHHLAMVSRKRGGLEYWMDGQRCDLDTFKRYSDADRNGVYLVDSIRMTGPGQVITADGNYIPIERNRQVLDYARNELSEVLS